MYYLAKHNLIRLINAIYKFFTYNTIIKPDFNYKMVYISYLI